jgi:hypothetical protein
MKIDFLTPVNLSVIQNIYSDNVKYQGLDSEEMTMLGGIEGIEAIDWLQVGL